MTNLEYINSRLEYLEYAPYGLDENGKITYNPHYETEILENIKKDLEMIKFLKECCGISYPDPNFPLKYHMIFNVSCDKEYEKLKKWLEGQE